MKRFMQGRVALMTVPNARERVERVAPNPYSIQNGIIRLVPLPLEWDSLAVARALTEEMEGAQDTDISSPAGLAHLQVWSFESMVDQRGADCKYVSGRMTIPVCVLSNREVGKRLAEEHHSR